MKLERENVIVFAGDSTTNAGKSTATNGLGDGYVKMVNNALNAFCPQNLYTIVNAGVDGDQSSDLLSRWDSDVIAYHPTVIFCMIGINDVWRHFDCVDMTTKRNSLKEYEDNLEAMCEKSKGVPRFIFMLPFFMESNQADEMRIMTGQYADVMRRVAKKHGYPVLDTQAVFDEYMMSRSGQTICCDRVHPQQIGSALLSRLILKALEVFD